MGRFVATGMKDVVQRVAFKAVIVNPQGQILLLREATTYADGVQLGKYQAPGGRLEPGESWQDGLRREVREETGLTDFEIDKPLYIGEWQSTIKGVVNQIIAVYVVCKLNNSHQVILSKEHDAYCWLSKGELPEDGEVLASEVVVMERFFSVE